MKGELVESRSLPSYELSTYQHRDERLHRIRVTDAISLNERITLYINVLELNTTRTIFCILDNSAGHENNFSYQDIKFLDGMLIDYGITHFYGATITYDQNYPALVKVANANAAESGMQCDLIATSDPAVAETFILGKLESADRHETPCDGEASRCKA